MSDPIPTLHCACGWARPLIAITRPDGSRPTEPYSVRYDCPQCGRVHHCGEVARSTAEASPRARDLASDAARVWPSRLF